MMVGGQLDSTEYKATRQQDEARHRRIESWRKQNINPVGSRVSGRASAVQLWLAAESLGPLP